MLFNSIWEDPVAPEFHKRSKIHQRNMVELLISLKIQLLKIMSSHVCKFCTEAVITNHHFPIKDKKDNSSDLLILLLFLKTEHMVSLTRLHGFSISRVCAFKKHILTVDLVIK